MLVNHIEENQEQCREIKIEEEEGGADMLEEATYDGSNRCMRATDEGGMTEDDSWQSRCKQIEVEEKAITLQNKGDADLMTCGEKELALGNEKEVERRINDAEQSLFSNSIIISDLICEENTQTATIWGQSGETSTFLCNPAVSRQLDKSDFIESVHVVCDYCQANKWKGEQCDMCCSNGKVQLQPVEEPCAVLTTFLSGTDHLLQHVEMHSSDLQMASLRASTEVCKLKLSPVTGRGGL
jgi:hypothetical protein